MEKLRVYFTAGGRGVGQYRIRFTGVVPFVLDERQLMYRTMDSVVHGTSKKPPRLGKDLPRGFARVVEHLPTEVWLREVRDGLDGAKCYATHMGDTVEVRFLPASRWRLDGEEWKEVHDDPDEGVVAVADFRKEVIMDWLAVRDDKTSVH